MRACFAIPGDITMQSGGYAYDRALLREMPGLGIKLTHLQLPEGFPFPSAGLVEESLHRLDTAVQDADVILIDGLALGALPPDRIAAIDKPIVALVHHPLGLETGLGPEQRTALLANERDVLQYVRHVIVTSETTKDTLASEFSVAPTRITVAVPGTGRRARAAGSEAATLTVLAVGAVIARKAYDCLIAAFARLAHLPCKLVIAGSLDRDPALVSHLRDQIAAAGLEQRVLLAGEVSDEELERLYLAADVFVLASHYEGYGMVLSEAMAHGLPIVTSTGGASGQTVGDGAALKVPPGDVGALSEALAAVLSDAPLRMRLAEAAWQCGARLPTWSDTAQVVASVLAQCKGRS